jgi:hypothetical protein
MTYRVGRGGQKFEKYFAFSHDRVRRVSKDPKKNPAYSGGLKKVVVDG